MIIVVSRVGYRIVVSKGVTKLRAGFIIFQLCIEYWFREKMKLLYFVFFVLLHSNNLTVILSFVSLDFFANKPILGPNYCSNCWIVLH